MVKAATAQHDKQLAVMKNQLLVPPTEQEPSVCGDCTTMLIQ